MMARVVVLLMLFIGQIAISTLLYMYAYQRGYADGQSGAPYGGTIVRKVEP